MKRKINWFRVFMLVSALCYYAAYLLSSELHVGETSVYFTYDNDWLIMAGLAFGAYLYSVVNGWVQEKEWTRNRPFFFIYLNIFSSYFPLMVWTHELSYHELTNGKYAGGVWTSKSTSSKIYLKYTLSNWNI